MQRIYLVHVKFFIVFSTKIFTFIFKLFKTYIIIYYSFYTITLVLFFLYYYTSSCTIILLLFTNRFGIFLCIPSPLFYGYPSNFFILPHIQIDPLKVFFLYLLIPLEFFLFSLPFLQEFHLKFYHLLCYSFPCPT